MEQAFSAGYTLIEMQRLPKQFRRTLTTIQPLLIEKFGAERADRFQQDCLQHYTEKILPGVPFIGGSANPFTSYLMQTTTALALYRVMRKWGGSLEEAGELIHRGMMLLLGSMPTPLLRLYGLVNNWPLRYARWRREALASQEKRYPADWVFSFVEGDGRSFDYGLDMHECGIVKYLQQEGAGELTPYLCAVDYITYAAMGVELRRTQAIAFGCTHCDFRIRLRGEPLQPSWPPAFPERPCCAR